jgi:endonuclease G, mitochondrial
MKTLKTIFLLLAFLLSIVGYAQENYLPVSGGEIVKHSYYTLSYSEQNEQAEWVYYVLTPELFSKNQERSEDFRPDPSVSSGSASLDDYKGSGYDRGHLAPAGDMKISPQCNSESFYLSNMSPQTPAFNRGGWKNLESLVRSWAIEYNKIYVVTGPVFKDNKGTIGEDKVTVPGYYYKVVFVPSTQKMIAFEMPNQAIKSNLDTYVVSVDKIESETGIDFFPGLNDSVENKLESTILLTGWSFTITNTGSNSSYRDNSSTGSSESINYNKTESSASASVQCKGIAKSTGNQCKNMTTNANSYCYAHQDQAPGYVKPKTEGYSGQCCATTKKGTRCSRQATGGSRYCWQHQ